MERRYPVFVDNFTSSDFYNIGGDSSSDEEAKSSGDEIDEDFNPRANDGSDSDSFEKEMEMELNEEFSLFSQHLFDKNPKATEKPVNETEEGKQDEAAKESEMETETGVKKDEKKNTTYDEIYFSSGSEDDEDNVGGVSSKSKERRAMKSDDELLYDPNMDDEDEKWVKRQRQGHNQEAASVGESSVNVNDNGDSKKKTKTKKKNKSSSAKNFTSDAILSCPACLTTLCIDCQRHDIYKQQFRAMFVMNCKVISDETLRYENKKQKKKSSKKNKEQPADISAEQPELYNPVQCTSCNTEVAVFDKEEIYHFFNVVESLP